MSKLEAEIRPPSVDEIEYIIENLRDQDRKEIAASHGKHAYRMLRDTVSDPETRVGIANGDPICLFGVTPKSVIGGGGTPWMVSTEDIKRHKVVFLRHSSAWVRSMRQKYGHLSNYVDDRNTVSKRWLRWLGFEFEEPAPYGVSQLPFRRFHLGE